MVLLLAAFALAGCGSEHPIGVPSGGIADWRVQQAYMPLATTDLAVFEHWGAALTIAPTIGATNAHNANLLTPDSILAISRDYDLLFFRTDRIVVPPTERPYVGEPVIAYGRGVEGDLREAKGTVRALAEMVAPRCRQCRPQQALVFAADAGPGFSGGPVVDAQSGAVLGIVFGYRDPDTGDESRLMYAYDIDLVQAEMDALVAPQKR